MNAQLFTGNDIFIFLSKIFERASYFGIRAIIVLYLVDESTLNLESTDVLSYYGMTSIILVFFHLLGGVIGDMLLGSKNAIQIGALLQAVGAFCFCIPSLTGVYLGMVFIFIGGGLYSPNLIAYFGKGYLSRSKFLDSAFVFYYLMLNIGAFAGPLMIGYCAEKYSYSIGFIIAGICALIAFVFSLLLNQENHEEKISTNTGLNKSILFILAAFLAGILYLISSESFYFSRNEILQALEKANNSSWPTTWLLTIESALSIFICFVVGLIYYFVQFRRSLKIGLGFIFGAIGLSLCYYLIKKNEVNSIIPIYIVAGSFFALIEILITPTVYSIFTLHSKPKYLGTIMGLYTFLIVGISMLFSWISKLFFGASSFPLIMLSILLGISGIAFLAWLSYSKQKT